MKFKNYFFNLLPIYFKKNDSYKDINGKGLFERYTQVFGDEWDESIVRQLDENHLDYILNQINPIKCREEIIPHIAEFFGNPPDPFKNTDQYRRLLEAMMGLFKIRGTKESYRLWFYLLGFNVQVIEIPLKIIKFDDDNLFDSDNPDVDVKFDSGCETCSYYDLLLTPLDLSNTLPTSEQLEIIRTVLFFNEPINAKLRRLIGSYAINETFGLCINQVIRITKNQTANGFDTGKKFDNNEVFDYNSIISTQTIEVDCQGIPPEQGGIGYWYIEDDFVVQ